ncbi:MAG: hypothetical protein LBG71_07735 [Clostridiales Family XIII bacterium]|jgi:hypothetical protein|nr:hypothetical protein [Clostridiales Family XIII bacterium]
MARTENGNVPTPWGMKVKYAPMARGLSQFDFCVALHDEGATLRQHQLSKMLYDQRYLESHGALREAVESFLGIAPGER